MNNDSAEWGQLAGNGRTAAGPELFDVLDENGHKTGKTKERSQVHRDGDWHRAVNIWVINDHDEVLLQKRAAHKDSWPGYWDISAGGHIVAGEDSLTAALQELYEELGLVVRPGELEYLGSWKSSTRPAPNFINNSFNDLYFLRTSKTVNELVLQDTEVSEAKFIPLDELKKLLENPQGDAMRLVSHSWAYRRLLEVVG